MSFFKATAFQNSNENLTTDEILDKIMPHILKGIIEQDHSARPTYPVSRSGNTRDYSQEENEVDQMKAAFGDEVKAMKTSFDREVKAMKAAFDTEVENIKSQLQKGVDFLESPEFTEAMTQAVMAGISGAAENLSKEPPSEKAAAEFNGRVKMPQKREKGKRDWRSDLSSFVEVKT